MRATWANALGKRANNEDGWLVDETRALFVVADGMGGHVAGEVAAGIAVHAMRAVFKPLRRQATAQVIEQTLVRGTSIANKVIYRHGCDTDQRGMGTTVVALALERGRPIQKRRAVVAWVGDSRSYVLRAGRLKRLTADHSVIAFLLETGRITPEAVAIHPERGHLLRSLGVRGTVSTDTTVIDVQRGDTLLLCSDGLNDALSDEVIATVLRVGGDAQALVDRALALEREGQDNLTAIVVRV